MSRSEPSSTSLSNSSSSTAPSVLYPPFKSSSSSSSKVEKTRATSSLSRRKSGGGGLPSLSSSPSPPTKSKDETLAANPRMVFGSCRDVESFKKLNRIGEGTYGIVYRAEDRGTGEIMALKKIRMEHENNGMPISSLREISILKDLKHENVVRVTDVVVSRDMDGIFLVMEYCAQDMATLLDNMKNPFTISEVKCLMLQLLRGIEYCHSKFIIHRDLKLSNLLLTDKGILKIADFGLARQFGLPYQPMTPRVVTLWYRPPEVLLGCKLYTIALDVWSVGCIFGELLNHSPLLPGKTEIGQLELIFGLLGTPNEQIWPGLKDLNVNLSSLPRQPYNNLKAKFPNASPATIDLLNKFLMYDPQKRITILESLKHPYFEEKPLAQDPAFMPSFVEYRNEAAVQTKRRRDASNERFQHKEDTSALFSQDFFSNFGSSGSLFSSNIGIGLDSKGFNVDDARQALKRKRQMEAIKYLSTSQANSSGSTTRR